MERTHTSPVLAAAHGGQRWSGGARPWQPARDWSGSCPQRAPREVELVYGSRRDGSDIAESDGRLILMEAAGTLTSIHSYVCVLV